MGAKPSCDDACQRSLVNNIVSNDIPLCDDACQKGIVSKLVQEDVLRDRLFDLIRENADLFKGPQGECDEQCQANLLDGLSQHTLFTEKISENPALRTNLAQNLAVPLSQNNLLKNRIANSQLLHTALSGNTTLLTSLAKNPELKKGIIQDEEFKIYTKCKITSTGSKQKKIESCDGTTATYNGAKKINLDIEIPDNSMVLGQMVRSGQVTEVLSTQKTGTRTLLIEKVNKKSFPKTPFEINVVIFGA